MLLWKLIGVLLIAVVIALVLDWTSGGNPRNQQGPYEDR